MASPDQRGRARRRPAPASWLLVLLAAVLVVVLAAAGCGSDDDEAAGTTTEQTTGGAGAPASVPDVQDADLADAAQQLADQGLRTAVKYVPSNDPRGRVIGQSRPPGTELQRGDAVSLNVSIGPSPPANVTVPDAAEQPEADGRAALERAGFEVLTINVAAVTEDVVVSQSPAAADRVPRGSLVILYAGG
jgi:beta-lactam-binding protein with PASTA domain